MLLLFHCLPLGPSGPLGPWGESLGVRAPLGLGTLRKTGSCAEIVKQ